VRRLVIVVAVLALAGCGESAKVEAPKAVLSGAAISSAAAEPVSARWNVRVDGPVQAISDLTARLIEHGFSSHIAKIDGVDQVLIGPFATEAEAQEKKAVLSAKLDIDSQVIEYP
jgi:cell division septation protein DedD